MSVSYEQGSVVALGMFDGMHMGHRELIMRAVHAARSKGLRSIVYTFENHPLSVIGSKPPMLMNMQDRRDVMLSLGIDEAIFVEFTRDFASMEPRAFIEYLLETYHVKCIATGFNYTFGRKGVGDCKMLRALGRELGFEVISVEPIMFNGEVVSSSRIREDILGGNLSAVNRMLCSPYTVDCTVLRRYSAPSLALELDPSREKVIPKFGTYGVVVCGEDGQRYDGTLHIDLESEPGWTLTSPHVDAIEKNGTALHLTFRSM